MSLSIQVKVGLFLGIVLLLTFGATGWITSQRTIDTMDAMSVTFMETLRKAGFERAHNVFASLETGAKGSLERGEMIVFAELLNELGTTSGVKEIGLTDADGRIVFTNLPANLHTAFDPGRFQGTIQSGAALYQQQEGDALHLARAHFLEADCIRCHVRDRIGDLSGVLFVRYDMADLHQAQADLGRVVQSAITESALTALFTGLGGLAVACLGIHLLIGRLVRRPLEDVRGVMKGMGEGDLTRRLRMRQQDELGETAQAMDEMSSRLGGMVSRLRKSADQLQGVSVNISSVSQQVNVSAKRQANRIEETANAVHGISSKAADIKEEVEHLTFSATESTSSALEMASTVEEVALSTDQLARMVDEISASIMQMAASIRQVADNSRALRDASDITASSMAEMDLSIKEVERNARQTATITEQVSQSAQTGKNSSETTLAGIREIDRAARITSEVIQSLSLKAHNIGQILSVIEDITEQTNLLALNAAIIAAQAGEQGKSFAVVAGEIRGLANRTNTSTSEITGMIEDIQTEARRAVETMAEAGKRIHEGATLSAQTDEIFALIVTGVRDVSTQMEMIALATGQQATGSRMIRQAMEKVSSMVAQSDKAMQEQDGGAALIAKAAEQMKAVTTQVRHSTRQQSETGRVIARAMESIVEKIDRIRRFCGEQERGTQQIEQALGDIQSSTTANVESIQVLQQVVAILGQETAAQRKELAGFITAEEEPAEPEVFEGKF